MATFQYGYEVVPSDYGEFRFIRISDINEFGEISEKEKKYVNLPAGMDKNKFLLKSGDILVEMIGNYSRTAIFQSGELSVFSGKLIKISFKKEVLPVYYWHFAQTKPYFSQVENLTQGSSQPSFGANSLENIILPIPPLAKQQEIIMELT